MLPYHWPASSLPRGLMGGSSLLRLCFQGKNYFSFPHMGLLCRIFSPLTLQFARWFLCITISLHCCYRCGFLSTEATTGIQKGERQQICVAWLNMVPCMSLSNLRNFQESNLSRTRRIVCCQRYESCLGNDFFYILQCCRSFVVCLSQLDRVYFLSVTLNCSKSLMRFSV